AFVPSSVTFNRSTTTGYSTFSLHDALPICRFFARSGLKLWIFKDLRHARTRQETAHTEAGCWDCAEGPRAGELRGVRGGVGGAEPAGLAAERACGQGV